MDRTCTPAEAFPVGKYLSDELSEREWTVTEFAEIIGQPIQVVSEILSGTKEITPETSAAISQAFGTTPELWLNLQTAHRLHQRRAIESLS
ncbi:HigA family addiction module antitoxin [Candidatus Poriferisocius sp.]|uniref:HigA family addiction module antitoxin n=1 Tax=Candidatus Poriferisocius sp. TaxID=3101276 RepID=UPI003B01FDEE